MAVLCKFFGVSGSGYYTFAQRLDRPEKDAVLAEVTKTVLRIMKKQDLLSEIRRRRKWQQVHRYNNLPGREFHADRPNSK